MSYMFKDNIHIHNNLEKKTKQHILNRIMWLRSSDDIRSNGPTYVMKLLFSCGLEKIYNSPATDQQEQALKI